MSLHLKDFPYVFGCMAELAACDASTEVELTDGDTVVLDVVGKIVASLRHGSNKHSYALALAQAADVIAHADHLGVETKSDLTAIRRKMVGDWILDDLDELLLG